MSSDSDGLPDETEDVRKETQEMLEGLSFNQGEATASILTYLPEIAAHLDGIRQELTVIVSILKENMDVPENEDIADEHDQIQDIMRQTKDVELNKAIQFLHSLGDKEDQSR